MFDLKLQKEKLMMKILDTSYNIKCIYENMNLQNKDLLEKELQKEIEKENKLLKALNIKENNAQEIYMDFVNTLNDSLIEDFSIKVDNKNLQEAFNQYIKIAKNERMYLNDLILKRFESFLLKEFKSEPVKSTNKDRVKKMHEDVAIITHMAVLDYHTSVVKHLDELSESSSSLAISNKAIKQRNKVLFTDKKIEDNFFNKSLEIDGFKKCVQNGHEQSLVEFIYEDVITKNINEQGTRCYIYPNSSLEDKKDYVNYAIDLQILKAGISLLNPEDMKHIYLHYLNNFNPEKKKSARGMIISLEEVLKENKIEKPKVMELRKVD